MQDTINRLCNEKKHLERSLADERKKNSDLNGRIDALTKENHQLESAIRRNDDNARIHVPYHWKGCMYRSAMISAIIKMAKSGRHGLGIDGVMRFIHERGHIEIDGFKANYHGVEAVVMCMLYLREFLDEIIREISGEDREGSLPLTRIWTGRGFYYLRCKERKEADVLAKEGGR